MEIKTKFDIGDLVFWKTDGGNHNQGYIKSITVSDFRGGSPKLTIRYRIKVSAWNRGDEVDIFEYQLYGTYEELDTDRLLKEKEECEKTLKNIETKLNQYKGRS